jgi:hypothetical protein
MHMHIWVSVIAQSRCQACSSHAFSQACSHGNPYSGVANNCPLSPTARVRHDAYGATLDFLEALCDTSFALVSIPLQVRVNVCACVHAYVGVGVWGYACVGVGIPIANAFLCVCNCVCAGS